MGEASNQQISGHRRDGALATVEPLSAVSRKV
jgi:hypothetical protein